jgi:hypothetical protein
MLLQPAIIQANSLNVQWCTTSISNLNFSNNLADHLTASWKLDFQCRIFKKWLIDCLECEVNFIKQFMPDTEHKNDHFKLHIEFLHLTLLHKTFSFKLTLWAHSFYPYFVLNLLHFLPSFGCSCTICFKQCAQLLWNPPQLFNPIELTGLLKNNNWLFGIWG